LIGFVTKLENPATGIDRINDLGISRFGTLMKIHKESFSDYMVNDKIRMSRITVVGITFARFKILTAVKKDGHFLANV
jgi:hypothetical protein